MRFLPIVQRDLLVASRLNATYWGRVGYSAVAFALVLCFTWVAGYSSSPRMLGMQMFSIMAGLAFIIALGAGMHYTADCISSEKREGTLGFLFLTTLKGHDVVLGKLCGNSLRAFYGLFALMPVMSIFMLLGGVTFGEIARVSAGVMNTLFLSLAAGVLCSTLCVETKQSAGWALCIMLGLTLGIPCLGVCALAYFEISKSGQAREFIAGFLIVSPGTTCVTAMDLYYRIAKPLYWGSLAVTHGLAWLMLLVASRTLPHRWQDRPATTTQLTWRERWQLYTQGTHEIRLGRRRQLLDINPIHWLTHRDRFKPYGIWGMLGGIILGWLYAYSEWGENWLAGSAVMTVLVLHLVIKMWAAGEVVRRFNEDRRSGALELLLGTPLTLTEIFRGQLLTLKALFLAPTGCVLAVDAILLFGLMRRWQSVESRFQMGITFAAGMAVLVIDLYAIGWLGMWHAISAKDHRHASGNTIVKILVLPWLLFYMGMLVLALIDNKFNLHWEPGYELIVFCWFAVCAALDAYFIRQARRKLHAEFRELASQREGLPQVSSLWGLLGRAFGKIQQRLVSGKQ